METQFMHPASSTKLIRFSATPQIQISSLWSLAAGLAIGILTLANFQGWRSWNFDDGMIVYRMAHNIVSGNGWSYNVGQAHNASTSVLNTLLLSLASLTSNNIPVTAHVLAALWIFFTSILVFRLLKQNCGFVLSLFSALAIVHYLSGSSTWGLETHLFGLLIIAFIFFENRQYAPWVILGLAILARPDALMLAGLKWSRDFFCSRRIITPGMAVLLLVIAPWGAFSLIKFGQIFPDTMSAKIWQGNSGFWGQGWVYGKGLLKHLLEPLVFPRWVIFPCYFLACYGFWRAHSLRLPLLYLSYFVAAQQLAYIFLNVPAYHWYFSLLDASIIIFSGLGLGSIARSCTAKLVIPPVFRTATIALASLGAILLGIATLLSTAPGSASDMRDVAYREAILKVNKENLPSGALATLEVGTIGYHTERPIVDLVGLASPNPEYISGIHLDSFFADPPPLVLLHEPIWHFENALFDDPRFRIMYKPSTSYAHPTFGLKLFILDNNRAKIREDEVIAFIREHYQKFTALEISTTEIVSGKASVVCMIDQVNGQLAVASTFTVPPSVLRINGWAVDTASPEIGEVRILLASASETLNLKGLRYKRHDVALHLKQPGYTDSGFDVEGSLLEVPTGRYEIFVIQRIGNSWVKCVPGKFVEIKPASVR